MFPALSCFFLPQIKAVAHMNPHQISTKKHSLVILRQHLDAAAIHWARTGLIFVHTGPNLCQLILSSAQCLSNHQVRTFQRTQSYQTFNRYNLKKLTTHHPNFPVDFTILLESNLQNGSSRLSQIFCPLAFVAAMI